MAYTAQPAAGEQVADYVHTGCMHIYTVDY